MFNTIHAALAAHASMVRGKMIRVYVYWLSGISCAMWSLGHHDHISVNFMGPQHWMLSQHHERMSSRNCMHVCQVLRYIWLIWES